MTSWFYVVQKVYDTLSGRDQDKTYVHVIKSARTFSGTFQELLQLAPWNDPTANDYAVEITEAEFNDIQQGVFPLNWGTGSLPKWQWNQSLSERGSWSDPEDDLSTWQLDTPIPDDRFIVRIYDGDPGAGGNHLAAEDFDEDAVNVTRYLKLFSQNDVALNTNAQNQQTEIAGKLMVFDFTAGVSTFEVARDQVGTIQFSTNHRYRIVGPGGETLYQARIFGRVLRAPADE